jgi:predicted nucleotidyltransferase
VKGGEVMEWWSGGVVGWWDGGVVGGVGGYNWWSVETAMMNECDRETLKEFSAKVREQFPEAQIWAFGSRARGDAQPDSDLDICVVIDNLDRSSRKAISHIAWKVGFERDLLITTVKYSRQQFESKVFAVSPSINNILKEGVAA